MKLYFWTIVFLGASGFVGGVYLSRENDAFHEFFTTYIPFGEWAVLQLEEFEIQKNLPPASTPAKLRDTGPKVTIPPQSGASWRVATGAEPNSRVSAVKEKPATKREEPKPEPPKSTPKKAIEKKQPEPKEEPAAVPAPAPVVAVNAPTEKSFKPPEVNEPSRMPPVKPIDPLAVDDATEPVVQEVVRMLNDIILVVNADNSNGRFSSSIEKAKGHVNKVGKQIKEMKKAVEEEAAKKVRTEVDKFEKAANEMVTYVQTTLDSQEARWRHEFAEEMERLRASYDERMRLMTERERKLNEERLTNRLLEQAVELKRQFTQEVKAQVEQERDGRLGKLEQLSSSIEDLEKLTAGWNDVVDTNLKTQQLHVAVEAVRASLEDASHPRPFVRELVALKEAAADNPAVDAAIASINPTAYQRGISTSSQLIDRFRRVANEVRKASLLPDGAGVASHASSWLLSHVMFKKQGLAAGGDVESILTRTQTLLEEGNLDGAAREMNGLTGWAKTLSRDWLDEVRRVLEVQQALDVIATEARLQSLKLE